MVVGGPSQFLNFCFNLLFYFFFFVWMIKYVPAVYIKAETRRKEKSMKNIATNFHEHLMEERKWGGVKDIFEKGANIS